MRNLFVDLFAKIRYYKMYNPLSAQEEMRSVNRTWNGRFRNLVKQGFPMGNEFEKGWDK